MWGTFGAAGGVGSPARMTCAGTATEIRAARVKMGRFMGSILRRGSGGRRRRSCGLREVAGLDDRDLRRVDVLAQGGEDLLTAERLDLFLEVRFPREGPGDEEV